MTGHEKVCLHIIIHDASGSLVSERRSSLGKERYPSLCALSRGEPAWKRHGGFCVVNAPGAICPR